MQSEEGPGYAGGAGLDAGAGEASVPRIIPSDSGSKRRAGISAGSAPSASAFDRFGDGGALAHGQLPPGGYPISSAAVEPELQHPGLGTAAAEGAAGGAAVGSWPSRLGEAFVSGGRHVLYCGADFPLESLNAGRWHHLPRPRGGSPARAASGSPTKISHLLKRRASEEVGGADVHGVYGDTVPRLGGPVGPGAASPAAGAARSHEREALPEDVFMEEEEEVLEVETDTAGGYHVGALVRHPAGSDPEEYEVEATSVLHAAAGGDTHYGRSPPASATTPAHDAARPDSGARGTRPHEHPHRRLSHEREALPEDVFMEEEEEVLEVETDTAGGYHVGALVRHPAGSDPEEYEVEATSVLHAAAGGDTHYGRSPPASATTPAHDAARPDSGARGTRPHEHPHRRLSCRTVPSNFGEIFCGLYDTLYCGISSGSPPSSSAMSEGSAPWGLGGSGGLPTIRAFGAAGRFNDAFLELMAHNGNWYFAFISTARSVEGWIGVRLDAVAGTTLLAAALLAMVMRDRVNTGVLALALTHVLGLTGLMQWVSALRDFAHRDREAHGRVLLVIAHRIDTVMDTDQLLVLGAGELLESGPPAQLAAAGGVFGRMVAAARLAGGAGAMAGLGAGGEGTAMEAGDMVAGR
ncbi:hypothetical protein TSOC_010920 [Tetrabaena socialis]|uniref:ABC transmembrane type-1 domain-containing protein n=1 Tax=Tetrabaena socialis TaxID=47790 RepID=A0A2J7ZRY0_9CHLO|nr:hypothetical protein TSOC_010920 [Tetrabaena socialis]|eukprot:PNH03031.1 hypothetical protein TSOC_010920 [Tetrabaena socialis]